MAKSNAQRQKEYRSRRNDGEVDYRLSTWTSASSHFALARLASRYGVTKRAMLERLLTEADDAIAQGLTDDEWDSYMRCEKTN